MKQKTILLVLLLVCTLQAQEFIQLGSSLKLQSLSQLHQVDTSTLQCDDNLQDVHESMEAWSEILENQQQLSTDSNNLQQLKVALNDFRGQGYEDAEPVLLQFRNSFSDIMSEISAHHLEITPYQRWRKESAFQLQGVVSLLDKADNEEDLDQCCDRIEKLIERLLKEREVVHNQCHNGPQITINVINTKADQIREIKKECSDDQGTIIRFKGADQDDHDQQIIPDFSPDGRKTDQPQEQKKATLEPKPSEDKQTQDKQTQDKTIKPDQQQPQKSSGQTVPEQESQPEDSVSEPSSTTDEEDDEESTNKQKPSDFTSVEPLVKKEIESPEAFKEYGYGYWTKFLLAYPKLLPNGKDAPWYFVSRLSSNQKDENVNMGDRLLAVFLGKGYYHFATCDQPKNQPNLAQNVNYPEDLDGIWTYIYYSYSVEKKRAVAFIKFGNDDVKKVVHEVQNPSTKWVRFTIGGKDNNRYPSFNGLIQQVYFSTKPGVFIDSEEDIIGKLQAQKKQPKEFMPELITYKVVSNPIQRNPEDKEILSIVGTTKNPKFPHEYAISGWFKWTKPEKQNDWHNLFRVQIQQPSTDKFLGDRTLSAWIGKQDNGILHLPTYTFTNQEGGGNPNVPKNIPLKDRHNQWFFVYFGYSRPEKKAIAQVIWKDSTDKLTYENIKHFQVPKYFVYVGKDKHFPGFSGTVALVSFNVGEGSFKQNDDFSGKGDPFNLEQGKKKLLGVQPEVDTEEDPEKLKKPASVLDDDADGITLASSSEENKPVQDQTQESEENLVEYGYGFWLRFLTAYPVRLLNGKNAPWYFVSRLTSNLNYKNIEMGDRLLAIWQGQGYYHFTTCDQQKNQPNVIQNINYPLDIEGLWTYVYYSYSSEEKKAIAFIKFGEQEAKSILHSVTHPAAKKIRFILGGKDNNQYPGFNGVFSQITFSARPGVFLDTLDDFSDNLKRTIIPKQDLTDSFNHELVNDIITRKPTDLPDYDEIGGGQEMFPHEYAISGWFKWTQTQQQVWHNIFRVQIKKPSTDRFLGDRTLSAWIGTAQNGILHFPTYTYTNMEAAGNANLVSNIQHKNRVFDWFFVYFGYSKNEKKAFVAVRFSTGIETLEYNNVNHYYTPKFYTFVGKDMHFPGFNGQIAYVNFNVGNGVFRKQPDFKHQDDIFGLQKGETNILKKPEQQKIQPETDKETGQTQIPNSVNDKAPKVSKEFKSEQPFQEYGYGFWMRFLTAYPVKLTSGKNAPWYFIARLANKENYGNAGFGDRTLAIWQGQGYYHFTTCNLPNNVNVVKNINYPADIEGLWTYVYYSYSKQEKKAVAFIQYGNSDPVDLTHQVTHPDNTYLKFILGGKDQNRYPGFNGVFQSIVHSVSPGAYIGTTDAFKQFLTQQPNPLGSKVTLSSTSLIENTVQRVSSTPFVQNAVEASFPKEYALSGWFKWTPIQNQAAWHNIFRVQISTPSLDRNLGDRTLTGFIGTGQGGVLAFGTYTYTNMNGAGKPNVPQVFQHKNRINEWFFVYFGYSKNDKQAYIYVKYKDSEENAELKDINHYFAKRYFIFAGKDAQYPGFSGSVAQTVFNVGEGSFRKGNDFKHPTDAFKFEKGSLLVPKVDPSKPVVDDNGVYSSKFNNNAPAVDNKLQGSDTLVEYGYGFWLRFLTAYPTRLINGKNQPWYFVSRLTTNEKYDNIKMGDRALAIWQGQGYYHFTTCNAKNGAVNVIQNINYPTDIEGLWTYVYYSYSGEKNKAVGFIKYGTEEPKSITHQVTHPSSNSVRFILGGMDNNRYPAFNGVFTKVTYSHEKGAFIETLDGLKPRIGIVPNYDTPAFNKKVLAGQQERVPSVAHIGETVGDDDNKLPQEYAISGWYKWSQIEKGQQPWHSIFRVTINSPFSDKFLGDRTFAVWVGTANGGILHHTTYTYANMNGAGNNNVIQNIVHKNRHQEWFYSYFGYNKNSATAYAYIKFKDSQESLTFAKINHYYAPKFFVYLGKDPNFAGFNGQMGYVNFNIGKGSFKTGNDFTDDNDRFGFTEGQKGIVAPPVQEKPEALPEPDKTIHASKSSDDSPKVDKTTVVSKENLVEYGYGYWLRFLTTFPERLPNGKNQPWYFVSRLTTNTEYDNIRMGDRALAIWQGQGYYHFTTCDKKTNNANVIKNIDYPADIEGVWTYVYYSYSTKENSAVAFIKYGDSEFLSITHQITHPEAKQVRFILGGTDQKRYPAFNGLFTNVFFSAKVGSYINSVSNLNKFLSTQGDAPTIKTVNLLTTNIIEKEINRVTKDDPVESEIEEKKLAHQYAFSGWFRWSAVPQDAWHNIFRVQIKTPSTDSALGDRTLSAWVGTAESGIIHLPTYTYTNMNGGGNSNLWKNIQHKGCYTEWFFLYFGYAKDQNKARAYIKWTQTEDNLDYPDTRHYYASKFFVFTGRDKHFPGFNGQISNAKFNIGEGSFVPDSKFNLDKDPFGFVSGVATYHKDQPKPKEDIKPDSTKLLDSATSKKEPVIDQELKDDKEIPTYGYGFWLRYLTVYPERLISGKNQPWYFVSRLTWNQKYDNIAMGDRTLAIWQGQGYYHFTTCNFVYGNTNMIQNINYPTDIEGLWTYVYYSYSRADKLVTAFIQYGTQEPQTITHQTSHKDSKYFRFILGGTDDARYPAFNGQFTAVTLGQNYIGKLEDFKSLVSSIGVPNVGVKSLATTALTEQISRNADNEISKEITVGGGDQKFPQEYSISGWFKWKQTAQAPWHNAFRVQIKKPSTDNVLGDRTLTMWIGTAEGGILHFPTYSYDNMVGGGNVNLYKNIQHKGRYTEWFYVYYGYSRLQQKAQVFVKWNQGDDTISYDNVKHFLTPEFYVFVGRDKFFPGLSGKIGYLKFNLGDGAFLKEANFAHPQDAFGYQSGVDNLLKKADADLQPGTPLTDVLNNGFEQKNPVVDKNAPAEKELEEYGYGFWFRFLHTYPQRLPSGKNAAWYFMARLALQEKYDNIRMGDRLLAIWQGQGFYHFTTCNKVDNNPNYIKNINYPDDIEGLWTYVYYSYSDDKQRAVAHIKFGNDDIQSIKHDVTHPDTKYVRFILGGNDDGRYPGFNGQFSQVTFSASVGVFLDTIDQIKAVLSKIPQPAQGFNDIANYKLVEDSLVRTSDDKPQSKVIGKDNEKFPAEYSFSGWFKWTPMAQAPWHNIFRVQIKTPSTDSVLGDRTLSAWVGTGEGGIIHLPTYTYTNMLGGGNANVWKNIAHKNRYTNWFFLYFGYSKDKQLAQAYIKWTDGEDQLSYEKTNHYLATQFYVFVGRDEHFPGFSGKLGEVNFNIGKGAFQKPTDYSHPQDIFGLRSGTEKFIKKPADEFKPLDGDKTVLENPSSQDKPILDKIANQDKPYEQYGYGFWLRFLTKYPEQLPNGKNQAWYFVSRLANQEQYDNIRMGDRMLAIWQGQGFYHFTACNSATNNPNLIQNNNYPDDIEGLWTYIYYSYNAEQNKAIGFIKYGNQDFQKIIHETTQPLTKQLRFIVGGTDAKRYPGFNGLFTSIVFGTESAFVSDPEKLNAYISKNQAPSVVIPLQTTEVVKDQVTRDKDDKPTSGLSIGNNNKFPQEYAISGWYRWKPTAQAPWHNVFRVQIKKTPVTDAVLGDRTLTMWIGTAEGGILHFPTYSYNNMNGAGNVNYYKNIQHKNRINEWFFVYYGYSKTQATAQIFVKWFDSQDSMSYDKINHYYVSEFQVWAGRDEAFPGLNGRLAYVNFNAGDGAFIKNDKYDHPQDIFKYNLGQSKLFDKQGDVVPGQINKDVLDSPSTQDKPVVDQNVNNQQNLEEYGYGFWLRFLTLYPDRLPAGKSQPWYFVARLANKENYDNVNMGDRLLAIWQGAGFYHFTTCNAVNNNANVIQNIDYPTDIEGLWTYVYYSYSEAKSRAVGFIKYGDSDIKSIRHDVTHPDTKYVRFTLGGTDAKRYPAFNGLFTQITFDAIKGTFIDTADQLKGYISKLTNPIQGQVDLTTYKLIAEEQYREKANDPQFNVVGKDNEKFPLEYAISGWFKWTAAPQDPWQNIFRVSVNAKATDTILGDRTLTAWIGTGEGGIIHMPTYTYANMNGGGNANVWKNIAHKERHTKWFYIYYGYSKSQTKAYAYIKWQNDDDSLLYENTNHYFAPNFQVFVGRDKFFPGWNGRMAFVQFNLGNGAFKSGKDFTQQNDAFGFNAGLEKLKKPNVGFQPNDPDTSVKENAFTQDKPIVDKVANSEKPFDEYGYGFWLRYLTVYPVRQPNGKNEAWYFVSRLVNQEKYDNIRMGDRMLAIWQGQGYYHFTAANALTNNPNMIQNVNYPDDIEGVWTYIYYSYSVEENKAQGFIKFGQDQFKQITHQTTQPLTKYLRFIVGGNDDKRYPGVNGLFTQITFSSQVGAYVDNMDSLNNYVNKNSYPKLDATLQNYPLIKDPITRKIDSEVFLREFGEPQQQFQLEYSISGWYKWIEGTPANQWQNLYRVLLKKEPTDTSILGDRTLAGWIGNGVVHQSTYTYTNMNGAGNNNIWKQAEHKDRHLRWFFVYQGYTKTDKLSYAFVQYYKGTETLSWDNVNHYFVPRFYVYVGRDAINGFNGQLGAINFNIGTGAFRKGSDFTHPNDYFGFGAPFTQTKSKQFDVANRVQDLLESQAGQEKPTVTTKLPDEEVQSTEEYGYGFWVRYLVQYPVKQRTGLQVEWSFVSRLSKNEKAGDITLGDRTLAIFFNRGNFYHFTTYDGTNPNKNVNQPVQADFEGVWTFIYYSHSLEKKQSVAYLKFGDDKVVKQILGATHTVPMLLQFTLGGKDFYNSYNGQFKDIIISASKGIYIDDDAAFNKLLEGLKRPSQYVYDKLSRNEIVLKEQQFDGKGEPVTQTYKDGTQLVPEYSWSGWFKWDSIPANNQWYYVVRVSETEKPENVAVLGDRTLVMAYGTIEGGIMLFSTYHKNNCIGGGDVDKNNKAKVGNDISRWHYVYFGYSLVEQAAYYRVEIKGRVEEYTFKDLKHYYPNTFTVTLGKDKLAPGSQPFVGTIAYFRFITGDGAFKIGQHDKAKDDLFGYNIGKQNYVKPSPTLNLNKDLQKSTIDSPQTEKESAYTKKLSGSDLDDINEYGYGFWLRFLTHYPIQLKTGLQVPWSFVARLTKNQQLQDVTLGDRVLAVWLNSGNYYHFTTYDGNNPNSIQNINNQGDIEGIWYYLHYSHSLQAKQSIGLLYNGDKVNKVVIQATHTAPSYLQLYLGGINTNYPAFNGQFSNILFSVGDGIFKNSEQDILDFLKDLPAPPLFKTNLSTKNIIEDTKVFDKDTKSEELILSEYALVGEYAWSGWFKWTPTVQQAWHLIVRLSILQDSSDLALLGDRTLTAFVGQGYFHMNCYTYTNINGGGNANQYQNMNYENDYVRWHFIYFGYSKTQKLAHAKVEFKDRNAELKYPNTNHYLPNKFSLFVGKDKFYNAYSGSIAYLRFNGGEGAFDPVTYGNQKQDIFGYSIGKDKVKEKEPEVDPLRNQEVLDSAVDQDKPVYKQEFQKADLEGITEYGYGFYYRHLEQYPVQMRDGRPGPWYIMSRLSWNKDNDNIRMGDRLLAIWQEQAAILFVTNNLPGDPNLLQRIAVGEREGVWTFLYFSYSLDDQLAVGILKFDGNDEVFHTTAKCNHGKVSYLKFTLGSEAPHFYPRFNGQFANFAIKLGAGAFVRNYESKQKYLINRIPHPADDDKTLKQVKVVEEEKQYKGDNQEETVLSVPLDQCKFSTEYSISGWLRWNTPIGAPWFNVFRLSLYPPDVNAENRFGDRDLALFKHNTYYQFHTYTYPTGGWTFEHVIPHEDQETQWHFFYFGYSRAKRQQYNYISFLEAEVDKLFEKQTHLVVHKHFLSFGKDFKKFYGSHRGFTGIANLVQLNYGQGAFTMKPIKSDDPFQYTNGKTLYSPKFPLKDFTTPKDTVLECVSDQEKPNVLLKIDDSKDTPIRGLQEYGWSVWLRWSRTGPKPLPLRAVWHNIARLTNKKDHKDLSQPGDRLLAAWLYVNSYYFSHSPKGIVEQVTHIPFKVVDGLWNFISISYKKGEVKAYTVQNGQISDFTWKAKHELGGDYLEFISGKEFTYSYFNGYMWGLSLKLGDGAHFDTQEAVTAYIKGDMKLPDSLLFDQTRKTVEIKKDQIKVDSTQEPVIVSIDKTAADGKSEYSISGWARWVDISNIGPWHILYRISVYDKDTYQDYSKPGDRQLSLWKGAGYFHFNTYTVDQVNAGAWTIAQNVDYKTVLHKTWVYFYQGYSKEQQKVHAYVKFADSEEHRDFLNINHFVPTTFTILLGKDKLYPGFSGQMQNWYFNVGKGSYLEKGYGDGETDDLTFGFGGRTSGTFQPWKVDDIFEQAWGPDPKVNKEMESTDDAINGITEYGYGFWSRFSWNGPAKLIDKPAFMALSRLTINKNYQGDAAQQGDRTLAIWVGTPFYHFTTYTPGNNNVIQNILYQQMLDGQWNYIWYGYKRFEKTGKVAGHISFNGQALRSTQFPEVTHQPITDYLYFSIGTSGTKLIKSYHAFNGQIGLVNLILGPGGYKEADDFVKSIPQMPTVPEINAISKKIFEEQQDMKREVTEMKPYEFKDEFANQQEYAVSLWFRWTPLVRVAWENVFTLSYHEQGQRANHVKPGDRVLSVFQYLDHRIFFSTYTTPDSHDAFAQIFTEAPVPTLDQTAWVYAYYAYSRKAGSVVHFLKTRSTENEKKLQCMHRVPKYLGLWAGKDGIHTPYNGKFAYLYLQAGDGAYRDKDYLSFDPYVQGATNLQAKPFKWTDQKDQFEIDSPTKKEFELDSASIDGNSAYSIGMWTRYLTAIPKRLLNKPAWLSIFRFTQNKDLQDAAKAGDRTLFLQLGKGFYGFRTYNLANNNPTLAQDIPYTDQLEGSWNFVYFCFSSSKQQALAYVKFSVTGDVKRAAFPEIAHKPIDGYGKLFIGAHLDYQGFNGQIVQTQMLFGLQGYAQDTDALEDLIKTTFNQPQLPQPDQQVIKLQDDEITKKVGDAANSKEFPDQYQGSLEYSVYGWFRYSSPTLLKDNNVLIRLTNNEASYRKDAATVGDRTLLIMYQPKEVVFATYDLGTVDDKQIVNIRKPTPVGSNFGVWTYVWFGYSWNLKKATGVVKFPTETVTIPYDNVLHMVPKYLALFVGSDGILGGWEGPLRKVGALFGKGAFVDTSKGNFESLLPEVQNVVDKKSQWKPEKEGIILVPQGDKFDKPGYDLTFKDEVGGVAEYGYGLWIRWLQTIPQRVIDKSPFHQLVRLTSTENYQDNTEYGNRVLATWVGKGYYHYTTYDKGAQKISIAQNINYDDYLEGNWNYIYYSFTNKETPRAVGFALFGDLSETVINRIEFLNIQHAPLNGYARVVVANNEFGYPAFNGMISSMTINFGQGFVGSKEQLLKEVIPSFPKPNISVPQRTDVNVLREQKVFDKDNVSTIKNKYDQYQGVLEYAVSGWVLTNKVTAETTKAIFRLTINDPSIQKDATIAGDRTLSGFLIKDSFVLSTYDYGDLDTNDDDQNDLNSNFPIKQNQGQWVYLYFGYNYKLRTGFSYALYLDREDSFLFKNLKHFVPNIFWFYLGVDSFAQPFEGTLFNWNLHVGDGAFTVKPKNMIELWPYEPKQAVDKVLSALLGNQGLSSIKLNRSTDQKPISGKVDDTEKPISGKVDDTGKPISGNLEDQSKEQKPIQESQDQGQKPISGNLEDQSKEQKPISDQVDDKGKSSSNKVDDTKDTTQPKSGSQDQKPLSGKIESGTGPLSGKIESGTGPLSGKIESGTGPLSGKIEAGTGPLSGKIEAGTGPLSGSIEAGQGPLSGNVESVLGPQSGQTTQSEGAKSGTNQPAVGPQSGASDPTTQ